VALLSIIIIFMYAYIRVRPLMGVGPSVSEFLEPYINAIIQLGVVGLIGLLLTNAYWRLTVLRGKLDHNRFPVRPRTILISLILVPLWLMAVYYVSKVYIAQWL